MRMRCDLDGKVVRCMFGIHGCSLPSLHDLACEIAAVLTLHCDVLVALQQGLESTGDALAWELQSCRVAHIDVTYCVPHVKMKAIV